MTTTDLTLIDLDQPITGFTRFISAWLVRHEGRTLLVDPGPKSTIGLLVERLRELGVARLDLVLVTHIHLDHSGGAAELLAAFPGAKLVCHESGVRHLVSPAKLWQGSVQVLGEVAEVYGEPGPVPAAAFATPAEIAAVGVRVIPTPGHAPHHLAFVVGDVLFAGEASGTRCPLPDDGIYLRPATPPRFFLDEALASLDALLALDPLPARIAFAHYGVAADPRRFLEAHRAQLVTWVDTLREVLAASPDDVETRFFETILNRDPLYARYGELPAAIATRERGFLGNTLSGMSGYLAARR